MTRVFKVTDSLYRTQAGTNRQTQWGPGVERHAPGAAPWSTENWLYCFMDPTVAALHAPVIVGYTAYALGNWELWECEADLDEGIWWPPYLEYEWTDDVPPELFPWTAELFDENRYMRGTTRLKTLATLTKPIITSQKRIDLLYALGSKLGNLDYDEINRSAWCAMRTMIDTGGLTATDAWLDKVIHEVLLPWSVYVAYHTDHVTFSLPDEVHTVMD